MKKSVKKICMRYSSHRQFCRTVETLIDMGVPVSREVRIDAEESSSDTLLGGNGALAFGSTGEIERIDDETRQANNLEELTPIEFMQNIDMEEVKGLSKGETSIETSAGTAVVSDDGSSVNVRGYNIGFDVIQRIYTSMQKRKEVKA
jgi:hypothetical protein